MSPQEVQAPAVLLSLPTDELLLLTVWQPPYGSHGVLTKWNPLAVGHIACEFGRSASTCQLPMKILQESETSLLRDILCVPVLKAA